MSITISTALRSPQSRTWEKRTLKTNATPHEVAERLAKTARRTWAGQRGARFEPVGEVCATTTHEGRTLIEALLLVFSDGTINTI